jgi:Domain of unknown function (DUF4349)
MRLSEEELARELRAERVEIDPDFAHYLDQWAAEGFPRAERPGSRGARESLGDRLAGLRARLAATPPRRLIAPVGAAATLVVVVGIALSQVGNNGTPQTFTADGGDAASAGGQTAEQPAIPESADSAGAAKATGERLDRAGTQALGTASGEGVVASEAQAQADAVRPGKPRHTAQTADLVLASEPGDVREVADGVNDVVNDYRGFVLDSSVQSGDAERKPGATFRLKVPAGNLQAALADLSELAHVQSRTERTEDITSRFVSAQERIEENEAMRQKLLEQLEDAVTTEEIQSIHAQLQIVNANLVAARNDLAEAQERVHFVPVSVSILSEEGANSDDGGWSVGDAIDDAGDVLSTVAGIAIVAGAALLPLALIGAIFAIAWRASANRSRERALDD